MPKTNTYDRQHRANVDYYQRLIDAIFEAATKEAAAIGSRVDFDPSRVFSFDDYPITQDLVKKLLSRLGSGMEAAIVDGVRSEWTLANNKNDELARRVFGDNIGRLTQEQYRRYFSNNDKAREAFLNRKEQGLNLSERVWRYADQFKSDIELGLDIGIRSGLDAPAMSRELQQFLQHPDMLFRRVRDEHGILQLSKRASEFHPGQGVYRSSYKNARRLAATETNMAYHSADHERWQQLDFVVGIEIRLSGNHTCMGRDGKPHPFHDICDELQGRYPKDFKFTGWHPHCRCIATSILKTEKELMEENRAILRGEEPSQESANKVTDVPDNFKKWVEENKERAAKHYTMPYFIKDNPKYVPKEIAANYGSKLPYDTFAEYEVAMKYNKKNAVFADEIKKNIEELNEVLPVLQGKVMNFTEADGDKPNPDFDRKKTDYSMNCGTCVPTYLLRRRGFDIEAGKYTARKGKVYELSKNGLAVWRRSDGTRIKWGDSEIRECSQWSAGKKRKDVSLEAFIKDNATKKGIYEVRLKWKRGGAHFTIVEVDKAGNLIYYDPQSGKMNWIKEWNGKVSLSGCWMMRIDDKLINTEFADAFKKAR